MGRTACIATRALGHLAYLVQVFARAVRWSRGSLRRGERRSALVVRDEVIKLDLGTAKDVERRAIREVYFAVRESFDESEVIGACKTDVPFIRRLSRKSKMVS